MARRASGDKPKKRKKVTVQLIKEKHAGEVTEPYWLLAELRATNHGHLADAKIVLAWRLGWRTNTDGHLQLGACKKRGDLDRELDTFDFVILLNKEAWAVLKDDAKAALIDHELCHAQIVMDADGKPKINDRERLVCRIRKHDVEEFRDIVDRHGAWTQDLARMAQAAINDASRPLLAEAEKNGQGSQGEPTTAKEWRKTPLSEVPGINQRNLDALHVAAIDDCGDLQDLMRKEGTWWNKGVKGVGEVAAQKIVNAFNAYVSKHPEAAA